jgi:lipopolysaccharide/colanic/teichoic acid biosynthesis glycosyltransferase
VPCAGAPAASPKRTLVDRPNQISAARDAGSSRRGGEQGVDSAVLTRVRAPSRSWAYFAVKRALDVLVAGVAFVVTLPVVASLAVLIKLDSPGPAIFRQYRVGLDGRLFAFYKFRTMWVDARDRYPELYRYQYSDDEIRTMYFKVLDDPRLTRLGRHLRRTSLDELPNLINALCGDMTLVGPRPELPEMVRYYTDEQLIKFTVKPGITGLAQVTGRAVLRFQETIAADLEYCHRRSFWFELQILWRTIGTCVARVGAF